MDVHVCPTQQYLPSPDNPKSRHISGTLAEIFNSILCRVVNNVCVCVCLLLREKLPALGQLLHHPLVQVTAKSPSKSQEDLQFSHSVGDTSWSFHLTNNLEIIFV